jgi:hypothetical protein
LHTYKKGWKIVRVRPVAPQVSPIVAWSFAEFLNKAVSGGGRLNVIGQVP